MYSIPTFCPECEQEYFGQEIEEIELNEVW